MKGQTGAGSRVKGKKEATALKQKTAEHLPEMTAEEEATLAKSRLATLHTSYFFMKHQANNISSPVTVHVEQHWKLKQLSMTSCIMVRV